MCTHPLAGLIAAVRAHQANPVFSTRLLLVFRDGKVQPSRSCVTLRTDQTLLDVISTLTLDLGKSPTACPSAPYTTSWTINPPNQSAVLDSRVVIIPGALYLAATCDGVAYSSEIVTLEWFDSWRTTPPPG